jgi:hypothetical protein
MTKQRIRISATLMPARRVDVPPEGRARGQVREHRDHEDEDQADERDPARVVADRDRREHEPAVEDDAPDRQEHVPGRQAGPPAAQV